MLGHKLVQVLSEHFDVYATIRTENLNFLKLNLIDEEKVFKNIEVNNFVSVLEVLAIVKPDVIINATGIIKQKPTSKDVIETLNVNSIFPHQLARIASKINARFITFSTDCVFDGKKGNYTELDVPNAEDLYGKSKNLGEVKEPNCLTIRTSIIGRELGTSSSLVEWFLNNRGEKVKGFVNAIYSGFPTVVLAKIIVDIIKDFPGMQGIYHVSSNPINKFELLKLLNKYFEANAEITKFEDFKIDRTLDSSKFRNETGFAPPSWEELVRIMFEDSTSYEQ